jgi:hypothetical protein
VFRDAKLARVDPRAVDADDVLHALIPKLGKPAAHPASNVHDACRPKELAENRDNDPRRCHRPVALFRIEGIRIA